MRWTVWQKRTKCQNCGAKISVPATGLTMTCQYCGTESAVPDIEERKQQQRDQEQQQRRQQRRGEAPKQPRERRGTGRAGWRLLRFLIGVGVIGAVLHFTGVLARITEPLYGDDGKAHYDEAAERLEKAGYTRLTREKTERAFTETKLFLDVKPGRRHALVLGSGQPLARVTLTDPRGRRVLRRDALRFHEALVFSPEVAGVYTATVRLESPGRYRWALLRGPEVTEAAAPAGDLLDQRRQRLERRRARARRRRARRARTTTTRARKRPATPAPKPEPRPEPPLKPLRPKVDPDIERALRAGEIDDDE
jgi:predicted RNA-binding Zn-ribbon protein involved in translation (DUF1610 family)